MENDNSNLLLYKRVNDLEAAVNKMTATCQLQHPVNLSEKISVCEIKIKNAEESLRRFENQTHDELENIKQFINGAKDGHNIDVEKLKDRFNTRIDEVDSKFKSMENKIHEIEGKINTTNLILTDMTNAKIKKSNNLSELWILVVGTIISSLIVGAVSYFFVTHDAYQQHKYQENYINNNRVHQVQQYNVGSGNK